MLSSFQSLVQAQLNKMQADFQAGKPFPQLPAIQDLKAFQVCAHTSPDCIYHATQHLAFQCMCMHGHRYILDENAVLMPTHISIMAILVFNPTTCLQQIVSFDADQIPCLPHNFTSG